MKKIEKNTHYDYYAPADPPSSPPSSPPSLLLDQPNPTNQPDQPNHSSKFYYAVKHGRTPGVYTEWKQAENQLYMFPGGVVRKFTSLKDANAFLGIECPFSYEAIAFCGKRKGKDIVVSICSTLDGECKGDDVNSNIGANCHLYYLDSQEYTMSHALLEALNDYIEDYLANHPYRPSRLDLILVDVRAYNILKTYLAKWKENLWMTTRGPVKNADMMKNLHCNLQKFSFYKTTYNPYHFLYNQAKKGLELKK